MKPPGGESKLNLKEDEDGEVPEEELEERCVRWDQITRMFWDVNCVSFTSVALVVSCSGCIR